MRFPTGNCWSAVACLGFQGAGADRDGLGRSGIGACEGLVFRKLPRFQPSVTEFRELWKRGMSAKLPTFAELCGENTDTEISIAAK
jgi:hypothetical protein